MADLKKNKVLLVQSPLAGPGSPPWAPPWAAGLLSPLGLEPVIYDANLDFYLNHILHLEEIEKVSARVRERHARGEYQDISPQMQTVLEGFLKAPRLWAQALSQDEHPLQIMRGEKFYIPEACLAAFNLIDRLLTYCSLAYYPCHLTRNGFGHPGINQWQEADTFSRERENNPFAALCGKGLARHLEQSGPSLVAIFACAPNQILPALTLCRFSKAQRPDLELVLVSDPAWFQPAPPDPGIYYDRLLSLDEPREFIALAAKLFGISPKSEATVPGPDFSGLTLQDYLAPEPMLSLRAINPQGQMMQPSELARVLEETAQQYACRYLQVVRDQLSPDYVKETGLSQPKFIYGIESSLIPGLSKDEMSSARQGGVGMITWQAPAGELEQLSQTTRSLWASAKAAIWNHVALPPLSEGELDPGLMRHLAINPHQCNSLSTRPEAGLFVQPDPSAANRLTDIKTAYSNLSPLPGRPFRNQLHDPAYLMLLQQGLGRNELIRLRVRDDGCTTYYLGQHLEFRYLPPQELSPEFFEDVCSLVEAGEAVGAKWIRYNLERAYLIGHAVEEGVVVGTVSLKWPRPEFMESLKERTGLDLHNYVERGYNSARPEYRGLGIGTRLVKGLTRRATDAGQKLYSTISEDNVVAHKIALDAGTKKVTVYYSDVAKKNIGVWIPEWMIEDGQTKK